MTAEFKLPHGLGSYERGSFVLVSSGYGNKRWIGAVTHFSHPFSNNLLILTCIISSMLIVLEINKALPSKDERFAEQFLRGTNGMSSYTSQLIFINPPATR